jgi:hypothetical protein
LARRSESDSHKHICICAKVSTVGGIVVPVVLIVFDVSGCESGAQETCFTLCYKDILLARLMNC